jgi:hypothetical protein
VKREVSVYLSPFRLDWTLGDDMAFRRSISLKKQPEGDQNSPRQGQSRPSSATRPRSCVEISLCSLRLAVQVALLFYSRTMLQASSWGD